MSLILEALKKSEQQRQREKAPNLQSIHQPVVVVAKKSARPWRLLMILIVVCNLAFLGYWFWRQQNAGAPVAQNAASAQIEPVNATAPVQKEASTQNNPVEGKNIRETEPEFMQISPRGVQSQPAANAAEQRVEEISELPENVRNNLPAMTFSFHVYSENPEQRTIIINDRRVREGEEIGTGLKLESITADGVILSFQQHRIHISVLSDW